MGHIVHRSFDPIQTELLGELLRDHGIAARVVGTRSGAMIGVGQVILQVHIEVPVEQAGPATDFLEAYFEQDGEALLVEAGVLRPDEDLNEDPSDTDGPRDTWDTSDAASERPVTHGPEMQLRLLFAAGFSLLTHGMGHVYSRRAWTALIIAGGQLWAIRQLIVSNNWAGVATASSVFVILLACDLIGSQLAARAHNQGIRRSIPRQLAMGLAFVSFAVAIGTYLGPRIPQPKHKSDLPSAVTPVSADGF